MLYEYDLETNYEGQCTLVVKREFELQSDIILTTPSSVADFFERYYCLSKKIEEHMYLLALDNAGHVKGCFLLGRGNAESCCTNVRGLFLRALLCNATRFLVVHNHPGGNLCPSKDDINVTRTLLELGNMLEIKLLDHIIVAAGGEFVSFGEKELL